MRGLANIEHKGSLSYSESIFPDPLCHWIGFKTKKKIIKSGDKIRFHWHRLVTGDFWSLKNISHWIAVCKTFQICFFAEVLFLLESLLCRLKNISFVFKMLRHKLDKLEYYQTAGSTKRTIAKNKMSPTERLPLNMHKTRWTENPIFKKKLRDFVCY